MLGNRTSARPKLLEPSGFTSPARAELALVIAAKHAADDTLATLEASERRLQDGHSAALANVEGARAALVDNT